MDIKNVLFLDIETVACVPSYEALSERLKPLWQKKAGFLKSEEEKSVEDLFFERAGIFAEFGKIVTIAVGYFVKSGDVTSLRVKAFAHDDEKVILQEFKDLLENHFDQQKLALCAHNGKEFDFPYISRRMLVNGMPAPSCLQLSGKKPWDILHLDTLEMWKFGDRKNFTSLDLLAAIFDIPSSKSDIDGSMVNHAYYVDKDLEKIARYCKQDVVVTAQLFLKFQCMELIAPEDIHLI